MTDTQTALSGYTRMTKDQEPATANSTEIDVTLSTGAVSVRVIGGLLDMNGDGTINSSDTGMANGVAVYQRQA